MIAQIKTRYRGMGFQRRLLLLVCVLVLLASFIAFALDYAVTKYLLTENAAENYQLLNAQTIKHMEDSLNTMQNAAIAAGYNPDLQRYIQKSNLTSNEASEMYDTMLNSLRMMYHTISDAQAFVVIPGNRLEYNSIHVGALNLAYRHEEDTWYKQVKAAGDPIRTFVLNNPQAYYSNGKLSHTMVIAVPFNSQNNSLGVAVYVLWDMERDLFKQYVSQSTLDVYGSLLMAENGEIVYSDLAEDVRLQLTDALERGESGTQDVYINGKQHIAVYDTSEFTGWRVVTLLRLDQLHQQLSRLSLTWSLLILVTLACMFPIIYRFAKRTTRPLSKLSGVMRSVRHGDMQLRVGRLEYREFEVLGDDFNRMLDQILALMAQNERIATLQKRTELAALQQQINPHFIFNTLGMIIGLCTEAQSEKVITICESMGTLLRYAISYREQVELQEELQYTRAYLSIVSIRYEGLFDVEMDVDPEILHARIVKMCLQPIIENAVKHGFADSLRRGMLRISCTGDQETCLLSLVVQDNGAGMTEETLLRLRETLRDDQALTEDEDHIGIHNVYMRLRLRYGVRADMWIESTEDEGTRVTISCPMEY